MKPAQVGGMVVRFLVLGLVCAGVVVGGCGGSSNDSKSADTGASAGQGGGPAAGGAGNNGKGGGNGGGISGGSGAGTAGASGGVVGSGGEVGGGGGAEGGGAGAANAGGANTGGAVGVDCRVSGCPGGLTCVPNDGVCASGGAASCVELDTVTCVERPVCGCDGTIYESNCAALAAGVFIGPVSQCTTPEGMIACINAFCDAASEYCNFRMHYGPSNYPFPCDQGPAFSSGTCHPFPAECGSDPTCECLAGEPFPECPPSGNCSDVGGRLVRTCLSGCYG